MPTNLSEKLVRDGVDVFKRGIRALGIETGAAKGDIKLTKKGAMVGEIASRLSGGFMSAYTYPYSTGVNLIRAALHIAMGEPPGDIDEKYHRVAVERAIIPGSGTVRDIQGIEEALSIEGVKNVFVTTSVGETVHIPTSNVEKCGNVIAVAETREEALSKANLAVQTVNILLGIEGGLNEGLIRKEAAAKLTGLCSVCRICDGVECAGWIPGIGSCGNGRGFRQNLRVLGEISILSDVFKEQDNINTGSDLFGIPLDLPVIPAPISNLKRNLHSIISEQEYNRIVLEGAKKSGSIGSVAQKEYAAEEENLDYLFGPLSDLFGHGIPFFNPYAGLAAVRRHIEKAFTHGAKMAALSVDVKDKPIGDRWLPELVKNSPVPLVVKGILSLDNARRAIDAGVKGLVLSNRGGRVLENLAPGYHILEEVRKETGDSVILIADGGIRSGEDVFKVLALGAHLVLIGRPIFISGAGAGMEGVAFYLNRIREELRNTMLLAGAKTVSEIKPHMIVRK